MENSDDFLRALNKFIKNHLRAFVLIDGTVTAVNDDYTCDILINQVPFTSVPTKVLVGSQASIYEIPVVGTACLVKWRDGHRNYPQIDSFDQVDKLLINCQTLVQFNGGENGGIPITPDLVTRFNNIEKKQNDILTILKGIIISDTPFDFGALFVAVENLSLTTAEEIQSTVITQ